MTNPSEGLAPFIVQEIVDIIRSVGQAGVSALIIEQNLRTALTVADCHYILNKGQVVFEGSSGTLRADETLLREHLAL